MSEIFEESFYALDGHDVVRVSYSAWAARMEDPTCRRVVAKTRVAPPSGEPAEVSTVFLGMDHRFGEGGPPLLFETMVFGGPLDGEQERYSTWEQAEAGHARMIEAVKAGKGSGRGSREGELAP